VMAKHTVVYVSGFLRYRHRTRADMGIGGIRVGKSASTYASVNYLTCNRSTPWRFRQEFFKRRLGKERGSKWPIADMYDLVAGALILLLILDPSWFYENMTLMIFILILILTPILHRGIKYHRVSFQDKGGSMVNKIAELLIQHKAIEFGDFTLASGKKSPYYVDIKTAVTNPDLLLAIDRQLQRSTNSM